MLTLSFVANDPRRNLAMRQDVGSKDVDIRAQLSTAWTRAPCWGAQLSRIKFRELKNTNEIRRMLATSIREKIHDSEIHSSHEKIGSADDDHCPCIGNGGMVGDLSRGHGQRGGSVAPRPRMHPTLCLEGT